MNKAECCLAKRCIVYVEALRILFAAVSVLHFRSISIHRSLSLSLYPFPGIEGSQTEFGSGGALGKQGSLRKGKRLPEKGVFG